MQYSPLTLAFLGDSVYEQLVRQRVVLGGNMPVGKLHRSTIQKVCAGFQSKAMETLLPVLSEEETDIYKRGRNATGATVPKHSTPQEYRRATGLEALFGFLYLLGRHERINEIFNIIWDETEAAVNEN